MTKPESFLAFVGTRGDVSHEIHTYEMNTESGQLSEVVVSHGGENPAFLALHPNHEYLYAVNQVGDGKITALKIDHDTGSLTKINERETDDQRPCYVSVDATGSYAMVAHHTGGSVCVFPIGVDGRLEAQSDFVTREGHGPDPDRQTKSRPHAILPGPNNRFVYVPDLGADCVWIYELDFEDGTLIPSDEVALHGGAGPRHLEFHPNERIAILLNELDATLTSFEYDGQTGRLTEVQTVNLLPDSFDGFNISADVHVHPSGKWVYGSNRGHNSISIFSIDSKSGHLDPLGHEPTRGEYPRNFAIDPTGEYLFVENQKSNEIVPFRIDTETGQLTNNGDPLRITQPVCMKMIPPRD